MPEVYDRGSRIRITVDLVDSTGKSVARQLNPQLPRIFDFQRVPYSALGASAIARMVMRFCHELEQDQPIMPPEGDQNAP